MKDVFNGQLQKEIEMTREVVMVEAITASLENMMGTIIGIVHGKSSGSGKYDG